MLVRAGLGRAGVEATRATETDALEAALKTAETVSAAPAKAAADALTEKESIIAAYARRHEVKVNQAAAMSASLEKSREEAKALAASAPLVLFTWESSPACKKALKYLEETGAKPKVVRLDDQMYHYLAPGQVAMQPG